MPSFRLWTPGGLFGSRELAPILTRDQLAALALDPQAHAAILAAAEEAETSLFRTEARTVRIAGWTYVLEIAD